MSTYNAAFRGSIKPWIIGATFCAMAFGFTALPSSQRIYSDAQIGHWETETTNCGNRLAHSGASIYVNTGRWYLIRGDIAGDMEFHGDTAFVGGQKFTRCL